MIDAVASRMTFQPANDWDLIFTDNPDMMFRIKSTTLPFINFDFTEKETGQKFIKGIVNLQSFTIEVYETIFFETFNYFNNWLKLIWNPETRVFLPTIPNTKKNLILMLNTSFVPTGTMKFNLNSVQLKGLQPVTFSYDNGMPLTYQIDLYTDEILTF